MMDGNHDPDTPVKDDRADYVLRLIMARCGDVLS